MIKSPALLTLCALFALTAAAQAQTPPDGPPPGAPPRDHRGPPPGGPRHGGLFLSPAGEPFRGGDGLAAWFAGADTDHDGALTLAEFRADAMRFFKVLDANHDGVVDGAENQIYETRIAPEILGMGREDPEDGPPQGGGKGGGGMGGGHGGDMGGSRGGGMGGGHGGGMGGGGMGGPGGGGPGGGPGGGMGGDDMDAPGGGDHPRRSSSGHNFSRLEGAARFSLINEPQPVRGADANLDWKVTAEEWAKAAGRRFALLDPNDTGKITLANLPPPGGRGAEGPSRKGLFKGRRRDD